MLKDYVQNSSFHGGISKISNRLEMLDEAELIRKSSIAHTNRVTNFVIKRGGLVRLLNKRGAASSY
jgi:hypothetical protein